MRINKKQLRNELKSKSKQKTFSPTFKAKLKNELKERQQADNKYWASHYRYSDSHPDSKHVTTLEDVDNTMQDMSDDTVPERTFNNKPLDMSDIKPLPKYRMIELSPYERTRVQQAIINVLKDTFEHKSIKRFFDLLNDLPTGNIINGFTDTNMVSDSVDFEAYEGSKKALHIQDHMRKLGNVEVDSKTYQPVTKETERTVYDKMCKHIKSMKHITYDEYRDMIHGYQKVIPSINLSDLTKSKVDGQQKYFKDIIMENIAKLLHRVKPFKYHTHDGQAKTVTDYTVALTYIDNLAFTFPYYCHELSDFLSKHVSTVNTDDVGLNMDGRYDGFFDKQNNLFCKILGLKPDSAMSSNMIDFTSFEDESIYDIDVYDDDINECKNDDKHHMPTDSLTLGKPEIPVLKKLKKRAIKEINYLNSNYYANQFVSSKTHEPITRTMMEHILALTKHDVQKDYIDKMSVDDINND